MGIIQKAKQNPKWNYSFSICATWAGAGSLIVGILMLQQFGVIPFLLWALGNTLCCVVFGILAGRLPVLRKIFTSPIVKIIIGFMCVFQLWINMSGIHDSLMMINSTLALVVTYFFAIGFLFLFLKFAMFKNVLTDDFSWKIVYVLIFILVLVSISMNGISIPSAGMNQEGLTLGVQRFFTLIVGAFFYPYFWELFEFNEKQKEGVTKVNMTKCFVLGGMLFGIYISFVFLLGMTSFSPGLEIMKGILLSLIALSSLTSFIYSIYISFGNRFGFVVNAAGMAGWYFLMPLGIMGVWNAMQDTRFILIVGTILISLIWTKYTGRKGKNAYEYYQKEN